MELKQTLVQLWQLGFDDRLFLMEAAEVSPSCLSIYAVDPLPTYGVHWPRQLVFLFGAGVKPGM